MIYRRQILQRDPLIDWRAECSAIRKVYPSTAVIVWILNVLRSTFEKWEKKGSEPGYENGRAILKLAEICRSNPVAAHGDMTTA